MAEQSDTEQPRPKQICFQCRNRKVRCDGDPLGCQNCRRLCFSCSLSAANTSLPRTGPPDLRRRASKACTACHIKKSKCSGGRPPCERCRILQIECHYPSSRRRGQRKPSSGETVTAARTIESPSDPPIEEDNIPTPAGLLGSDHVQSGHDTPTEASENGTDNIVLSDDIFGLRKSIIQRLLEAFFEHVYPIAGLGFIHRPSLMRTWLDRTHNPRLLRVICGVTARFTTIESSNKTNETFLGTIASDGRKWLAEAERQILDRHECPMRTDIAALILLAFDHGVSGRLWKLAAILSFANRLASLVRLNDEEPTLRFTSQEWRRRLMWGLWMLDTVNSDGRANLSSCPTDSIHLRLPCNERSFQVNDPVQMQYLGDRIGSTSNTGEGLWTYMVRVLDIRRRIQERMNQPDITAPGQTAFENHFVTSEQELEELSRSLPGNLILKHENLCIRLYSPSRVTFLMLHIWLHQAYIDLYGFLVWARPDAGAWIQSCGSLLIEHGRNMAFKHALAMSQLFSTILQMDDQICITDPSLAPCTLSAARLIAPAGHPVNRRLTTKALLQHLRYCVDILRSPSELYPTTKVIYNRLCNVLTQLSSDTSPLQLERASCALLPESACVLQNVDLPPEGPYQTSSTCDGQPTEQSPKEPWSIDQHNQSNPSPVDGSLPMASYQGTTDDSPGLRSEEACGSEQTQAGLDNMSNDFIEMSASLGNIDQYQWSVMGFENMNSVFQPFMDTNSLN